ncbi:MAG: hypothetical protein NTW12_10195 [Deltaproteobacteria bacterium]|nr:hypothetical protein [Deltaproteobacteria bacterium]
MTKKIWFVVHHENLWDIDNNLIGFWNKEQVKRINIDDVVIYYRAGRKKIMGVFKIVEMGDNLNPDFYDDAIVGRTRHQCRLTLMSKDIICNRPTTENRFSFYEEWRRNRYGGLAKQVFEAEPHDLQLILRDTSVLLL